jgi:DNA/RNA endonuclease YhcR with UshA esterase domain
MFLLLISVSLFFVASTIAQTVTTIADVQDTTGGAGGGDSHLNGQIVTVEGVVSAESWAFGGSTFYIQDGSGPWSGIMVYDSGRENAYGDSVRITAMVKEYYGMTELVDVTEYVKLDSGKTVQPTEVITGEIATDSINAEAYEGVLVKVTDVVITNPDIGYGEWEINDGSGAFRVHDTAPYYFIPGNYESVISITGVLNYNYSNTKIEPRLAWDIVEGGKYTRIQRFQQVRHSDLLKAFEDESSDTSYAVGDTLTVKGVVTMPTGLSYAGDGIKFILSEVEGGPWSAVLSYHADSSAYPVLLEGDVIEMTGYISEYTTGPSNMTELFITSEINILEIDHPLPAPDPVKTGDLRLPVTAEQWGNVMVYVKDATITNVNPAYELFAVDDGSGSVLVDDDSDSLDTFYSNNPIPPLGTIADSLRGWVYHHYGAYTDSTAYKLEPLYMSDIKWGAGPPAVSNATRDMAVPTSSHEVTITADVATNLTVAEVALYYNVSSGEPVGDYTKVVMAYKDGLTYEGKIPTQVNGSFVNYYILAQDDQGQSSTLPADITLINLCYAVEDGDLGISDIQYTPWALADSPLEGMKVSVTGIVTSDTAMKNHYDAYSLQDAGGKWNGLFAFGINEDLNRGDEITVHGTVTDYNADWHFKWDNNTVILVDSFSLNSSGNSISVINVTSGELGTDTTTAESYEGVVVKISDATLISVNNYDATFDDGSGPCLIDDDITSDVFKFNYAEGYILAFGDTIKPGEVVEHIQGVFTFSFGTFKIEVRDENDFGNMTGVNPDYKATPLTYQLLQNYPNPFNPETRISFEIPQAQEVTLVIYNVLGQKVRTLIDESFNAGRHIINWDGLSESGLRVPTGMYFYRIKAGNYMAIKKMVMVK